uniref:Uncharacterized protein n=1 Tax=Theileria annulata TaxID=5874 RepID=A0A3B0MUI2_THEAN
MPVLPHSSRPCRLHNFRTKSDTSIADDLDAPGYCKRESRLVLRSAEILPEVLDVLTILRCHEFTNG